MENQIDSEIVRKAALVAIEYSHDQDDFTTPLAEALDGVTAVDAAWKMPPTEKCIWEIVLHLARWAENLIVRVHGDPKAHTEGGSWPSMPAEATELAWEADKQRLFAAVQAMRSEFKNGSMSRLTYQGEGYGTPLDELICRAIHSAYHVGQITKLKEWRESLRGIPSG